jgi:hypothetical protein
VAWVRLTRTSELRWHPIYRGEDADALRKLAQAFQALNRAHFGAALPALPILLSGRMRSRLGHIVLDRGTERPIAIVLGRKHVLEHEWREVRETLLHEMVHLWQSVEGMKVDHGPRFRAKAREVGVTAAARRKVRSATRKEGNGKV